MMKKRGWIAVVLFTMMAAFIITPGTTFAKNKPVTLKLVIPVAPDQYPLGTSLYEMKKNFNERAKGEYVLEIYPGQSLAKFPEYFDAVRIGAVDMASATWALFAYLDPKFGLLETPFLFNNEKAGIHAAEKMLPLYDQILQEKFNAKGLSLVYISEQNFLGRKPVKTLEDLKGRLMGTAGPVGAAMVQSLGGSPMSIVWTDLYESLQKRVVDGTITLYQAAQDMNLFSICKEATMISSMPVMQGLSINLDVWKKMPPHIQKILTEEVAANYGFLRENWPKTQQKVLTDMADAGVTVYKLPEEERNRWIDATSEYREKQLGGFGEFGKKVRQIAEEANQLYPYQN